MRSELFNIAVTGLDSSRAFFDVSLTPNLMYLLPRREEVNATHELIKSRQRLQGIRLTLLSLPIRVLKTEFLGHY